MEQPKPSVLWIHGWGQSPQVWGQPYRWLPDARHSLFTFAGCDSIAQMRERLHRMVSELAGPVYLIGWSLGGMLALDMVLDNWESTFNSEAGEASQQLNHEPNRGKLYFPVDRLILIGTTLRFTGEDRASNWPERVVRRMRTQLADKPGETLRKFGESMFSVRERGQEHAIARIPDDGIRDTDFTLPGLDAGLAYLAETDLTQRWQSFIQSGGSHNAIERRNRAPRILWMHGEEDPICPVGALQHVPEAMKVLFPGAGHAPFWTEPDRFAEQLRRVVHEH